MFRHYIELSRHNVIHGSSEYAIGHEFSPKDYEMSETYRIMFQDLHRHSALLQENIEDHCKTNAILIGEFNIITLNHLQWTRQSIGYYQIDQKFNHLNPIEKENQKVKPTKQWLSVEQQSSQQGRNNRSDPALDNLI